MQFHLIHIRLSSCRWACSVTIHSVYVTCYLVDFCLSLCGYIVWVLYMSFPAFLRWVSWTSAWTNFTWGLLRALRDVSDRQCLSCTNLSLRRKRCSLLPLARFHLFVCSLMICLKAGTLLIHLIRCQFVVRHVHDVLQLFDKPQERLS